MEVKVWDVKEQFLFPASFGIPKEIKTVEVTPQYEQSETEDSIQIMGIYHITCHVEFEEGELEWAYVSLDIFTVFDFKIISSVILLLIYVVVLLLRNKSRFIGTNYAWIHIYAFLFVLINFLLGSQLSQFHFWY